MSVQADTQEEERGQFVKLLESFGILHAPKKKESGEKETGQATEKALVYLVSEHFDLDYKKYRNMHEDRPKNLQHPFDHSVKMMSSTYINEDGSFTVHTKGNYLIKNRSFRNCNKIM
jgi:magnesium-transporting ATPase (P-type)